MCVEGRGSLLSSGGAGDDVGAVVRARASLLAEVELEKLNLRQKCWKETGGGRTGGGVGGKERRR